MRRRSLVGLLLVIASLLGPACDANDASPEAVSSGAPPTESPGGSPSPVEKTKGADAEDAAEPSPEPPPPEPDYELGAPVPHQPQRLAAALTAAHEDLRRAVAGWLESGGSLTDRQVATIQRIALFQQRIYRQMTRAPELGRATLRRIDPPLRERVEANFKAGNGLSAGLTPLEPPIRLETTNPESPHKLLSFYRQAERRFGVNWAILAAVNFVETRFGRILGPSTAGALGPMQFLPSTWEQYGAGGDIRDPRDAILGAARYLRASGALRNPYGALFNYNRSDAYVQAVLAYARQMRGSPKTFYEYYFWQVFVRTTKGDVQLTGPGGRG